MSASRMLPDNVGKTVLVPPKNKFDALSMENVTGTVTKFAP